MTDNPYAPPKAELDRAPEAPRSSAYIEGTLEGALNGDFQLPPMEILRESRGFASGYKGTILLGAIVLGIPSVMVGIFGQPYAQEDPLTYQLLFTVIGLILSPLTAGLFMLGVRRSVGGEIAFGQIFAHLDRAVPILLASLITTLVSILPTLAFGAATTGLGLLAMNLYTFVLSCLFMFTFPLVIDREMSPFEALGTSARVVFGKLPTVFGYMISFSVILVVFCVVTLMIGVFWALPWTIIASGVAYRRAFGVVRLRDDF